MVFFKTKKLPDEIPLPTYYDCLDQIGRRKVREAYIQLQKGLCYYCKGSLYHVTPEDIREKRVTPRLYPEGFFENPIHLHHNHDTGMTIGAVHAYCNAVLWEHEGE